MSFHGLMAHFFLVLDNILLSGWTAVYLSIYLAKHLGCFQVLAVMGKIAIYFLFFFLHFLLCIHSCVPFSFDLTSEVIFKIYNV